MTRKYLQFSTVMAAVLLGSCGESSASEADGTAATQGSGAAGEVSAPADVAIPAAFRGEWDMRASDSCTPDEPRYVVGENWTSAWTGERKMVIGVSAVDPRTIELEGAPNPEAPDADQRFGLSLGATDDEMTLFAPGTSSTNFVRCASGQEGAAGQTASARGLDAFPERFRGQWGYIGDGVPACSEDNISVLRVEPRRLQYYEGHHQLAGKVTADGADEVAFQARYVAFEETENAPEPLRLKLSAGGTRLQLSGEGFDPWNYERCDG